MAAPTPSTKTFWDGVRGLTRYSAGWTGADTDLSDSIVVDVSALSPTPPDNSVKIRTIQTELNGNYQATLEFDNVASGTVNTATAGNAVTWVSGDKFDTNWLTYGNSTITINSVSYTISSISSAIALALSSDPGDQAGVTYSVDEFADRFIGQSDISNIIYRDYTGSPNSGLSPVKTSSSHTGDLLITTSGAAAGDEISLTVSYERT